MTSFNWVFTSVKTAKQLKSYIIVDNNFILLKELNQSTLRMYQDRSCVLSEVLQNLFFIDFSHQYCCWDISFFPYEQNWIAGLMFKILQNTCLDLLELIVVSVTTLISCVLFNKDSLLQLKRIRPLFFAFASSALIISLICFPKMFFSLHLTHA